jgi:hypothetical protein
MALNGAGIEAAFSAFIDVYNTLCVQKAYTKKPAANAYLGRTKTFFKAYRSQQHARQK